jgi:hypothetical protein
LAFIAVATMKLFAHEKYKAQPEKNGPTGLSRMTSHSNLLFDFCERETTRLE